MTGAPQAALTEFGRLIGIPSLVFDAYGYCCLLVDEITVNVEYDAPSDEVLLYAHLGLLPANPTTAFYEMLLAGNFFCRGTAHATLGIDLTARIIVLYDALPAVLLDGSKLEDNIARFADSATVWKKHIADFAHDTRPGHVPRDTPDRVRSASPFDGTAPVRPADFLTP